MTFDRDRESEHPGDFSFIDKSGWISLIFGFIFAFIPFLAGGLRWIMSYLKILIHELGHSVIAWLFGYPCVPTFNLRQGGGLAMRVPQANWLLAVLALWSLFT